MTVPVAVPSRDPDLPRRDGEARAQLAAVGASRTPLVLARDRTLVIPGPLGEVLPAVQRGTVIAVGGVPGSGAVSAVLAIAAAATGAGEWAAMVDGTPALGGLAAAEAGVDLARFAVVRDVSRDRWATVVAALLDGMSVVIASVPRGARAGDARRLVARARERAAVLVALSPDTRGWPVEAALRLDVRGGIWPGLGRGVGALSSRASTWEVSGRGMSHPSEPVLERTG